jgi:MATE family, multidrug efflux pump
VLVSLVAEPITGLVDTAFVARLGAAPLAALGVGTVLLSSVLWAFNFLGVGTQTEVAQALGAGQPGRAREIGATALALAGVCGLALGLAAWPLLPALARFMGASGEVETGAVTYLGIRLWAAPALLATLAAFGALRGLHDMRTPLAIAVGANALNALLDPLLIFGAGPVPALGIAGAAWATVASQWLAGIWAVAALHARLSLSARVAPRDAAALLVVGRDLFLRTALLMGFLVLATRAATRVGVASGAAHQAIRQVWLLTALALDAYAATAQSLVGYFVGAGRASLARRVAAVAAAWSLGTGAALAVAMWALQAAVAAALVPPGARGPFASAWWIAAAAQPLNALSFVTDGIHWGTRDYRYLRNAMAAATGLGALALLAPGSPAATSLAGVWAATAAWTAARAALGCARVWPGVGAAPLAAAAPGESAGPARPA